MRKKSFRFVRVVAAYKNLKIVVFNTKIIIDFIKSAQNQFLNIFVIESRILFLGFSPLFKKAFLTNSSGILCSRVFGFLRDLSMASVLGAGIYSDIFFVAFKFPNLFRRIFSEGAFTQSFLPSFIATRKKGQFCVAIFGIFFVFLVAFSLIVCAFSGFFTKILAYGFDESTIALAKPIVAINFWYLCLIFSANFFSSLLQYKNNFWVSAYNTALLNIAMIVALFVARDKDAYTIVYFLSYGVLVGGALQILLHCYSLYKLRFCKLFVVGFKEIWRNLSLTSPSIAEGDKGGGCISQKNNSAKFSNNESTHPLTPSAREGEEKIDSANCTKNADFNTKNDSAEVSLSDFVGFGARIRENRTDSPLSVRARTIAQKHQRDFFADIKSFFAQFFPALLGSSTAQIASFIDTLLASFLVSGSVSYLYYANRIFQLPLALFAIATSTALFPMVAKALRNGNESQSLDLLSKGFWLLIFALSVCVVGGIMLKNEIIWLLFERGKFTRTDTIAVANVFMAYLIGLLPYGVARIFSLWLYSLKMQGKAAKISAISLAFGVLCSIVLMQFFGAFGLALSSSMAGFMLFILTIRAFGFAKFRKIIAKPKFFVYLIILLCVECGILFLAKTILGEFYAVL